MSDNDNTLRNGLEVSQVEKCKSTFRKINLAETCRRLEISPATVRNVLAGKSPRLDILNKAIKAAEQEVREQNTNHQEIVDACR